MPGATEQDNNPPSEPPALFHQAHGSFLQLLVKINISALCMYEEGTQQVADFVSYPAGLSISYHLSEVTLKKTGADEVLSQR